MDVVFAGNQNLKLRFCNLPFYNVPNEQSNQPNYSELLITIINNVLSRRTFFPLKGLLLWNRRILIFCRAVQPRSGQIWILPDRISVKARVKWNLDAFQTDFF